jgi:hypothetical protein
VVAAVATAVRATNQQVTALQTASGAEMRWGLFSVRRSPIVLRGIRPTAPSLTVGLLHRKARLCQRLPNEPSTLDFFKVSAVSGLLRRLKESSSILKSDK